MKTEAILPGIALGAMTQPTAQLNWANPGQNSCPKPTITTGTEVTTKIKANCLPGRRLMSTLKAAKVQRTVRN